MTPPNVNALWGRVVVDELANCGVRSAVVCPGSRSTPLTVAVAEHPDVETYVHLDERSAAFFALGRARATGVPTPLVSTSGTAAAEFHPAVVEAHQSRAPMMVLTADRPPELHDSGANQTIDQAGIYGDAVRDDRTLPEPEAADRKLRSLRTAVCRAVGTATGRPPGPVHLNVPFRKPLAPTVEAEVPAVGTLAREGRDGPFVAVEGGRTAVDDVALARIADAVGAAERPLLVAGPADAADPDLRAPLADLAATTRAPVLADPLSGLRFGPHLAREDVVVCGGYDAFLAAGLPDPDVVLRVGASPTSKLLREYLRDADCRQFVVDPAGGWREATFAASDLVVADPGDLAGRLADRLDPGDGADPAWTDRFRTAEDRYWSLVERFEPFHEGDLLATVASAAPDPATLVVGNSMPVRDLDRFGRPRGADLTVLGNRGASGIDGTTSTALGAASATDEPVVLALGDLAYLHDANGLLAASRFDLDATVVVVDNDGGGIFHELPVADHDAFEEYFLTPHDLDLAPTGDLYGVGYETVAPEAFADRYRDSVERDGTQVLAVRTDGAASHDAREALQDRVREELG